MTPGVYVVTRWSSPRFHYAILDEAGVFRNGRGDPLTDVLKQYGRVGPAGCDLPDIDVLKLAPGQPWSRPT